VLTFLSFAVPISTALCLYAGFMKLSARLLRYTVSWKSSFAFAAVMLIVATLTRMLDLGQPPSIVIGHGLVVFFGLLILGTWFFSKRGTDPDGDVLGFNRAFRLAGLAFLLMFAAAGALFLLGHVIFHLHPTVPP
jgi:hypothetical protein